MRETGRKPERGLFYGWYVVGAVFFMVFVSVGFRQTFGLFVDTWNDEFGVTVVVLSAVASAGWIINGLSQPLLGALTDRFGARLVMSLSMLLLGISAVLMALAQSILMLALVYALLASFALGGVQFTPTTPLIAHWFRRKRGAAMSAFTSGGSLGAMVLVPFVAYVMALATWRVALMSLGGMMLLLSLPVLVLVVRNTPHDMGLSPDGDDASPEAASGAERSLERPGPLAVERWSAAYRSAPMWQLTLSYVVCGVTTGMIAVHIVPFAISEGITKTTAALAFGLLNFINMLAVIGFGVLSDRMLRKDVLAIIYVVRGVGFLLLLLLPPSIGLWAFAVVGGSSWLASVPQTSTLAAEIYGVKNVGTIVGMLTMVHQLGGAAAVLLAGTAFTVLGSYTTAWAASVVLLAVAAVLSWAMRERAYSTRFQRSVVPKGFAAERA